MPGGGDVVGPELPFVGLILFAVQLPQTGHR